MCPSFCISYFSVVRCSIFTAPSGLPLTLSRLSDLSRAQTIVVHRRPDGMTGLVPRADRIACRRSAT